MKIPNALRLQNALTSQMSRRPYKARVSSWLRDCSRHRGLRKTRLLHDRSRRSPEVAGERAQERANNTLGSQD
ncbi:hypothetical protein PsYK624_043740 [Phanerochaete sordida]|uniref:Uncharacterized protein n=1 Tax=Phanerochaete sordida TaxID=48140 RepID=A0A9P3G4V6_9APHY|nr:hypothetical protein PsYK624_043740 [Phanerochaete sordida]